MTLPTIVLVHGAWHIPANYQSYISALKAQGFTVHCPLLPSCNKSLPSTNSLKDDVNLVRGLISSLTNAGERIIMIMHSYGGVVGTDAVEGLAYPRPSANGQQRPGGVIHLLYLCAYILQPGTSVWDIVQEAGFDKIFDQYVHTAEDGSMFPLDPGLMFFGGDDSVDKETIDEALKTLVRFPKESLTTPTVAGVWRHIPTTYVLTQKDYGVPRVYQDIMIAKIKGEGVDLRMEDFDTCHSIFISREKEMVQLAIEAADDPRNAHLS
ncbi:Alpha/beta hydrolase fold-1 [Aspergillus cavernicola]|uniref:Alpha/beta hydrolase fold-1 n=1 Tax=Aspergillus cavernicola TaxID=176166 RepID=A0ABR4IU49_9EURO